MSTKVRAHWEFPLGPDTRLRIEVSGEGIDSEDFWALIELIARLRKKYEAVPPKTS